MKVETNIARDFYKLFQTSSLPILIDGKLYREEERNPEAKTEDALLSTSETITANDVQSGYVMIAVYTPFKLKGSNSIPNLKRVAELQEGLQKACKEVEEVTSEYDLHNRVNISHTHLHSIGMTRVYARLNYRRTIINDKY